MGDIAGPAAMPGGPAAGEMALRYPTLALAFAFTLVGYSIWDLDQLSGRRYSVPGARLSLAGMAAQEVSVLAAGPGSAAPRNEPSAASAPDAGLPGPAAGRAVTRRASGRVAGAGAFLLAPAVTIGCRIVMGVAMAFMLFIAI
jgi:hypothetical protein